MINLPQNLAELLEQKIKLVKQTTNLTHHDRMAIYRAFGDTNYPNSFQQVKERIKSENPPVLMIADLAFCWLGIITSRRVLPILKDFIVQEYEYEPEYDWLYELPIEMLNLAERLITGNANWQDSFDKSLYGYYYHIVGHIDSDLNVKAVRVCYSAYDTLCLVFLGHYGVDYEFDYFSMGEGNFDAYQYYDFALDAVKAYSSVDENEAGSKSFLERVNRYKPVWFDLEKQAEFWLWWLEEAVPQAWKLAHETKKLGG
jgi:hypothetical protein